MTLNQVTLVNSIAGIPGGGIGGARRCAHKLALRQPFSYHWPGAQHWRMFMFRATHKENSAKGQSHEDHRARSGAPPDRLGRG